MKMKFLILCLLTAVLHAEEPSAAKKEPTKPGPPLRLLALGDAPPFRQEMRGDRRVEIEAVKGSLPPSQIVVDGEPPAFLSLGQASLMAHMPPLANIVLKDQTAIWSTLMVPDALLAKPKLALFWRDPGKSWDSPHSLLLADGPEAFPAGQVRFVNLLPTVSAVRVGDQTHELTPGQVWLCPAPEQAQTLMVSFRGSDGNWLPVQAATLEPAAAGMRVQVVIYRSDSPTARRPAKALVLREQAIADPPAGAVASASH